jgi:hypothetical protein
MIFNETFTKRTINWNLMSKYAFVLSPFGIGMDCHRTWEALCLGCIPIVKTSSIDNLYNDLPVLIVKEWKVITIELLNDTISTFKAKIENNEFNIEKLNLSYWLQLINSYK